MNNKSARPVQHHTGQHGEKLAAEFLTDKGFTITTTNWHCPAGELDIVARQGEVWVFVEVKTRRSLTSEAAFASITSAKRDRLVKAVYAYLENHELDDKVPWRVDVVAVTLQAQHRPLIEHVEDALDW